MSCLISSQPYMGANSPRALAQLLEMAGTWPATYARNGDSLEAGRILIAPPDHHLIVRNGDARVTRGPRENRSRPSIDVLFRSAAVACRGKTIGVLLTGMLDDGVVGLEAIHRCGGVTVVQDPSDALILLSSLHQPPPEPVA